VGVVKGYPRLRKRFGKLVGYIQLVRPFTLLAPLLAGIFGVLSPVTEITFHHVVTAIYVGVTLALAQGAGQCINQFADVELDKMVKPHRPVPSGLVSREEALGLSWLLAMFAVGRAFTISTFFGLTVLVLLFFAVFYSLAPFSPRRVHPVLNTGWMAFSRGFMPMLAVWSVYGSLDTAWRYSILAFFWVMGFQATKDVPDVEGDRKFGIKTIPNTHGMKGQVCVMAICTLLYAFLTVWVGAFFMLTVVPLSILATLTVKKQAKLIENTVAWGSFYSGLALIYVLMFVGERLAL